MNGSPRRMRSNLRGDLSKCESWRIWVATHTRILMNRLFSSFSLWTLAFTAGVYASFIISIPCLILSFSVLKLYRGCLKWHIERKGKGNVRVCSLSIQTALATDVTSPLSALLLNIDGKVEITEIKKEIEASILMPNQEEKIQSYLMCNLKVSKGFYVWERAKDFNVTDHVTLGACHHHGRTLTERNIQEYMSEVCSENLDSQKPPWEIFVTYGVRETGEHVTWVLFRAHQILTSERSIGELISFFSTNWDMSVDQKHLYPWFTAPSSICRFAATLTTYSIDFMCYQLQLFVKSIWGIISEHYLVSDWIKLTISYISTRCAVLADQFRIFQQEFLSKDINLFNKIMIIIKRIALLILERILDQIEWIVNQSFQIGSSIITDYMSPSSIINLTRQAAAEINCMFKALVLLPKVLAEEFICAHHRSESLNVWRNLGKKRWKRTIVAWSEGLPINNATGIQGVTGASIPAVLLTALTGGIRDLIRSSGAIAPDFVRCSVPVYSLQMTASYGLLALALPTGASLGQSALKEVRRATNRIRERPEIFTTSIWIVKLIPNLIPQFLLQKVMKHMCRTHPILLTNLIGPKNNATFCSHSIKSIIYWRPPQHGAVLSVCITSYNDEVSIGILADGWSVPHANSLPQTFVSHLNELAVESGVKLSRQGSRNHSRSSSPTRIAPPTPTLPKINPASFSQLTGFRYEYRRKLNKRNFNYSNGSKK